MWLQSIQQAIEYIEEHLTEELKVEQIAKVAHSSSFHFQRAFSILTGMSVGEYIRGRRLTLAAQEIASNQCKIIDVAYKYGYETPEAFAKAFRKQHGMKPSDVRKEAGMIHSYNKLVIHVQLKGADPMQYKIVEKEGFRVVGVKRTFSCVNGEQTKEITKFWQNIYEDGTNDQLFPLNTGEIQGVIGVCDMGENNLMDYWIATNYAGEDTKGFETFTVPAAKWAVFEVKGAMPTAITTMWEKIYQEWLPSNAYELTNGPELEVYSNGDATSPDYYSEIWLPIK
ncbi:AraC family transcriptional regulator [Lysinibacillus sp. NPDC096418]|uniref:AraC family transcriptional regulator n=1 Tax=Lysinibacillus sp. NPDC096418 TaxID=3364138 RepID=UPI0038164F39